MPNTERPINPSIWIVTFIALILQVSLKFSYDDYLNDWGKRAFHFIWISTLYFSLTQILVVERPKIPTKVILIIQFMIPVLLSFVLPRMHLGAILSIPWLLIIRMKILLSSDRWDRVFDVAIALNIIISTILIFLNGPDISSELTDYIFFEILSNILTLGFVIWMFRLYVLKLKSRVSNYEEEAWHHKWYYSLMLHLGHNLRTPLAAVNSNLDVIKFKVEDPKVKASLDRATEGGDKLKKMVNSLITASNMNHIKEQGDTVANVLKSFVEQAEKSIVLVDQDPCNLKIKGPEIVSFVMAIDAFTDNSLRHGASQVSIEMHHDHVLVKDSGPGLPHKVKERITNTSKEDESHEGFGSSLYFVMTLLRESGWHVALVEWNDGVEFKLERAIQNWAQKVIS